MRYAIQWVRSFFFIIAMYGVMPIVATIYLPRAIASREGAIEACHAYCRWVVWLAHKMIGLRSEIKGTPPTDEVMVAAKHQSFMDVIIIYGAMPRGKFIMKSILKYAPILGWFALRIGCVPVDRGKRGVAIKKMLADVESGQQMPGQLVIYPQGTRISPGVDAPYKQGTAALYQQLNQPCVPVACNVGVFWPKRGIYRKPGVAVIEFCEPISPGMERDAFLLKLRNVIESRSDALAAEAGFVKK